MTESFNITQFLKNAVASGASDEHLKVGQPPYIRKNGFMKKVNMPILSKEDLINGISELAPKLIYDKIQNCTDFYV
mgnify:CR=1 FL=1